MGRVFSFLRSHDSILRVFGWATGFMRAVTSFSQGKNLGTGLRRLSHIEHPGCGCRLRKRGGVGEGVGRGREERGGGDGGRRSLL